MSRNRRSRGCFRFRSVLAAALALVLFALSAPSLAPSGHAAGKGAGEEDVVYTDIPFGATGDDVLTLQKRLNELSYYTGDVMLTPSVYDEGTQRAVERFCEANNIAYAGTGASADLQSILFSNGALAYTPPETKLSFSQKAAAYMKRPVEMLGGTVPMYAVWAVSVLLVVLILFLCIFFFVPGRDRETPAEPAPKYWKRELDETDVRGPNVDQLSGTMHLIDLRIHYDGKVTSFRRSCDPALRIGRDEGNGVRLDPADRTVSGFHCELYFQGAVLMLRDHSTNGTYVNGRLIHHSECRLNKGDCITIGAHQLMI